MNDALLTRLASLLPPEGLGRWTRDADGASFPLAAPAGNDQWREVMRFCAAERLTLLPIGLASKLGWTRPAAGLDLVVSTRRDAGVVAYEPGDGTVTARAGTTLGDLRAVVGEGGHHLAPDVPRPETVTLGGVIAAGASGLDRLRFGPIRDQILGATLLLGDGTITKSGGRLVKNVTGYALPRLWCGSHGTLGVILEASLRLWPYPETRAAGVVHLENRGEALDLALRLRELPVAFTALGVHDLDPSRQQEPWTLLFLLGGRPDVVQGEIAAIREAAPKANVAVGSDAGPIAKSMRDLELSTGRWPTCELHSRPSEVEAELVHLTASAGESGLAAVTLTHPGIARTLVWLDPVEGGGTPEASRLVDFHRRMAILIGPLRWLDPSGPLPPQIEPLGTPAAGLSLMQRVREAVDPDRRFAGGRLHAQL